MIPVYQAEKSIESQILSNNRILASCQIIPKINKNKIDVSKLSLASEYDKDLYHLYTIMVSTGINKNDDVFTRSELWTAKDTPIDKPLNVEHQPRSIIGHIIESRMISDQYEEVEEFEDDGEEDDETYHLLTGGVIYKHLGSIDGELEQECAKLIEEIDNGEWFVSMECLFADFDYALIHPVFGKKYVQRNDTTAFLTKYLRIYGGEGHYNSMKIGRVLKGLLFSGKGLVKNPANPNSIILNNVEKFSGSYASLNDINVNNIGDDNMSDNFEAKYAEAQNEIMELKEKLAQADQEQYNKIIQAKDAEIAQLNETILAIKKKMDEKEEKDKEEAAKKEDDEKCKAALEAELQSSKAEIIQLKTEKLAIDRVSVLVSAGVAKADAEQLVQRFAGVSDEQFCELVELQKKLMNITSASEVVEVKEEKEEEVVAETTEEETNTEVLDTAEVIDDAALSVNEESADETNKVCASVAEWVNSVLKNK